MAGTCDGFYSKSRRDVIDHALRVIMNGMTARPAAGRSRRAAHAAARIDPAGAGAVGLWLSRNADPPPRRVEQPAPVATDSPEEPRRGPEQRPAAEPAERRRRPRSPT